MKIYRIKAANKVDFDCLIRDYEKDGFVILTQGYFTAELKKGHVFIIIEFNP